MWVFDIVRYSYEWAERRRHLFMGMIWHSVNPRAIGSGACSWLQKKEKWPDPSAQQNLSCCRRHLFIVQLPMMWIFGCSHPDVSLAFVLDFAAVFSPLPFAQPVAGKPSLFFICGWYVFISLAHSRQNNQQLTLCWKQTRSLILGASVH